MDRTTWTDQTPSASVEVVNQEAAATNIKTDEAAATDVPILMGMDLDVFNAAKEGKIDVLRGHDPQHLNQILTPTRNTVLHVYIAYASTPKLVKSKEEAPIKPTNFVEDILQICPTLLWQQNESGETALHMAAKHGLPEIGNSSLFDLCIREKTKMDSTDQTVSSTPLALANAVEQEAATDNAVLIRGMDLDVFNAAKEGKTDVLSRHYLDQILTPTKNTVLHIYIAFASSPNYVEPEEETLRPPSVVNEILQMCPALLSQKNESGETALHIVARHGHADIVERLIETAKAGRGEDTDVNESHLIVATLVATVTFAAAFTMPGGYYQIDASKRNVTAPALSKGSTPGYAVLTKDAAFIIFVISDSLALCLSSFSVLMHLYISTHTKRKGSSEWFGVALYITMLALVAMVVAFTSGTYAMRLMNVLKRNGAASGHRILSENNHDGQKLKENKGGEVTETKKNIRESHLIVATLVATVTFAAGITMPGGYYQSSDQGNAMSNVSQQNVTGPALARSNGPTPGYAVRLKMGKSRAAAPKRTETKLKTKSAGASKRTSKKAGKDPNKPKRPASAFFVFMEDFREKYKKEHPNNKSVAAVGKAGGDKWKSLSDAEKAPYVAKAEKRKTEYNKTMQAYNKSIAEGGNGAEEEESDKSKSEVNNEEEEDDESAEDEDDDE
ncbi:hypothetical protein GBA52_023121 [Prunus armeniaca]|nr:hypothetical protein GBA52_023121 [Prunus armeniaca]